MGQNAKVEPLEELSEDELDDSPPEPTLTRRVKSCSDFYGAAKAQVYQEDSKRTGGRRQPQRRQACTIEALDIPDAEAALLVDDEPLLSLYQEDELLEASQQKYSLYHDQLAMTERHLETLLQDTDSALKLLASLSESFEAVEEQTSSFKSQCDDLLSEQQRLQTLADEVGTDLHYYAYLDNVTRRLNAPGAGRLVDDDAFGEILDNLDSCIAFMTKHSTYRDAEQYLARYQALMTKALHLLEHGFTSRLDKASADISPKIAASKSESARHALAYGRFEELLSESYSLLPNVRKVVLNAYDEFGYARLGPNFDVYSNTVNSIFQAYLSVRDRDLRPIIQKDFDAFRTEAKGDSVEPAARNLIKQCFERSYSEMNLFSRIFSVEPQYNSDATSVYGVLKSNQRSMVNPVNIIPIANNLQTALQPVSLQTTCDVIGWAMNEYLSPDYDDDETGFSRHCRELTARLLTEHLWAFTDAAFETEITKTIAKAPLTPETLTIGPVTNGIASSNAYPPVKRALELLILFDQCMPKERCQRSSPVIYDLLTNTLAVLQRAEARIRSLRSATDPDLFMIKNLLLLKNELVALEITSISSSIPPATAAGGGMQHFSAIWDSTLSLTSSTAVMGFLSGLSSYIPHWRNPSPSPSTGGKDNAGEKDASERLDDLLRQSIFGFTSRWGQAVFDARTKGKGVDKVEKELEDLLQRAFAGQGEVVGKLKEAVQASATALGESKRDSKTRGTRVGSRG